MPLARSYTREELESMSDEELLTLQNSLKSQMKTSGGGGFNLMRGIKAGLQAYPKIMLEGKAPVATKTELTPFETERQKLQARKMFERPKRVGLVNPITGAITETETEADVVLKGILEKPEKELTPSDLVNIYRILSVEPAGEVTRKGGLFREEERAYSPEQIQLRQRAKELLERSQVTGASAPVEPTEPTEPIGKDEFGYTVGEEVTVNKKRYKYIGNNQWQQL